jgi:hypothetical protein
MFLYHYPPLSIIYYTCPTILTINQLKSIHSTTVFRRVSNVFDESIVLYTLLSTWKVNTCLSPKHQAEQDIQDLRTPSIFETVSPLPPSRLVVAPPLPTRAKKSNHFGTDLIFSPYSRMSGYRAADFSVQKCAVAARMSGTLKILKQKKNSSHITKLERKESGLIWKKWNNK